MAIKMASAGKRGSLVLLASYLHLNYIKPDCALIMMTFGACIPGLNMN